MLTRLRTVAALGLVVAIIGLWSSAASAHVTVSGPYPVTKGSYAKVTFRVPNEREDAGTIKLHVKLPSDKPFSSVSVKPKAGWTVEVTKAPINPPLKTESGKEIKEAASEITWTAEPGTRIAPGQFDEFDISVGTLPKDADALTFPAIQTYDAPDKDGKTDVEWIEKRQAGQADPRHPEPQLKIVDDPAKATAQPAGATVSAAAAQAEPAGGATEAKDTADSAKTLGALGLLLGGVALVVAIGAVVVKPKRA